MKKLFTLIAVLVASAMVANAQIGIVAGIGSSNTEINTEDFAANLNGVQDYHLGLAFKLPLPLGFAIQPELIYQVKGAEITSYIEGTEIEASSFNTKNGYGELNLGLQWGIDLVAFRPFAFVKPFIGYQLTEEDTAKLGNDLTTVGDEEFQQTLTEAKNKLEYGFSIGAGIELLEHFQVSLEWFKNLGTMFNEGEFDSNAAKEAALKDYQDLSSYGGIKLSLGFFF